MTAFARKLGAVVVVIAFALAWFVIASDYGDGVTSGTYHLARNGETSILTLNPDHTFKQELNRLGKVQHASGNWHRSGEAGVSFSKEFLEISGQEFGADGVAYGHIEKKLGLLVSLRLSQYHVLWYGRTDPSPTSTIVGTYAGDEEGVRSTLVLKQDHMFEQTISRLADAKHAEGKWITRENGDIVFSREFLKTSGEALRDHETASAWDPRGSNLQIQIEMASPSGAPTFRKKQFPW
jgi:hypothetical protein